MLFSCLIFFSLQPPPSMAQKQRGGQSVPYPMRQGLHYLQVRMNASDRANEALEKRKKEEDDELRKKYDELAEHQKVSQDQLVELSGAVGGMKTKLEKDEKDRAEKEKKIKARIKELEESASKSYAAAASEVAARSSSALDSAAHDPNTSRPSTS